MTEQTDKVKRYAISILQNAEHLQPDELMGALDIAIAGAMQFWPPDKHRELLRAHMKNVKDVYRKLKTPQVMQ